MTDHTPIKSVIVEYADGHWWVTVIESGEQHRQSFESQEHAESYAAGQLIRLGLDAG